MQNVLSGMYGVDALQRPLNQYGFPVDPYGNCLTPAPVTEVYNYGPSQLYIDFLWAHFGYHYYYRPGFVHLYSGPGVYVYRNYGRIPYGHTVIVQHNYHAPIVNVRPSGGYNGGYNRYNGGAGVTTTVRPGFNGGAPTTVRPGVGVAPARPYVAPPAVAPARPYVAPPRATSPSMFNRPSGGSFGGGSYGGGRTVSPPRSSGPSMFRRH
jgi:hypothetical protein